MSLQPRLQPNAVMAIVTAGLLADALWRRSRAARLQPLPPAPDTLPDSARQYRVITAAGVDVDEPTRRAAVAYAHREGLAVLDLVPRGLDALRAMELVRRLDPASYRTARLARGEGGGHALLVAADVVERAGLTRFEGLTTAEMDALTERLKRYASVATDLAVTPAIDPVDATAADRRAILRRRWLSDLPTYLTARTCWASGRSPPASCSAPGGAPAARPDHDHDARRAPDGARSGQAVAL
ncbi:hypothetical protein GCM10023196_067890 [Actinoallomurus vinaceus]|uniref:Uncharacterized protein n=1 Tax=Actinoallomurus vinaceus TaxID=1080074 RepID=A0ABP8UJD0_9ACTN